MTPKYDHAEQEKYNPRKVVGSTNGENSVEDEDLVQRLTKNPYAVYHPKPQTTK
tara:strand:+ start:110 stop:271 length:162 start_codon:yes stop_codon:yes gene_type:complete